MNRAIILFFLLETVFIVAPSAGQHSSATSITATVDPTKTWNTWDGWGSSLAWWARAIGGTRNAGIYADLIYTTSDISVAEEKYPGLGFNIARYNVGGGGIKEPLERKSPQMPWFRDIHGYWTNPDSPVTDYAPLPRLAPGDEAKVSIQWKEKEPLRVVFDVQRPTGFSAFTKIWTP